MAEITYKNIDGELPTQSFGYNNLLAKDNVDNLETDANTDNTNTLDLSGGINSGNSSAILGSGSVPFTATTMNVLQPNQDVQSANFVSGTSGWQIKGDGTAEFLSITLTGGTLKYNKTSFTDTVNAGYHISSAGFYFGSASDTNYIKYNIATGALAINGAVTTNAGSVIATSYLSGAVGLANTNIAAQGWTSTCVFSATDYRVVAWAIGVITTAAGTAYNIIAGNTGNMAETTYIYLDIAVSITVLQITTIAATAIGSGKILVAVASPNVDTVSKAQYQVFGGIGGIRLFVDNISANSASTNEFISNSAQIANLVVTDAKINTLSVAKLTTGAITSKAITLAVAAGTGNSYIAAGKTLFDNSQNGFILGIDDSDPADTAKFYIGSSTTYLNWDDTNLTVAGVIQTAAGTGRRIVLDNTNNAFNIYDASNNNIVNFTSELGVVGKITQFSDSQALQISNDSNLTLTSNLFEVSVNKAASTAKTVVFTNEGSGTNVSIVSTASSIPLRISPYEASGIVIEPTAGAYIGLLIDSSVSSDAGAIKIDVQTDSASTNVGMAFHMHNVSDQTKNVVFNFQGDEVDTTKTTSVTNQFGVIRIQVAGVVKYIPIYSNCA